MSEKNKPKKKWAEWARQKEVRARVTLPQFKDIEIGDSLGVGEGRKMVTRLMHRMFSFPLQMHGRINNHPM